MITYSVEKIEDTLEELKPLLELHHKEGDLHQEFLKLNPAYDQYLKMEQMGMTHFVSARDTEGSLVGYFLSIIHPNLHYKDALYGVCDIVYVDKAYRKTKTGLDMFKFVEEKLKALGVSVLTVNMKTTIPFDSLCLGLGYEYDERMYSKYIGEK